MRGPCFETGGPRDRAPSGQLQITLKHHHPTTFSSNTQDAGTVSGHQNPAELSLALWGGPIHGYSSPVVRGQWSQPVPAAD